MNRKKIVLKIVYLLTMLLFYSCNSVELDLKREADYQSLLHEDFCSLKDKYQSEFNELKYALEDKTNPLKAKEIKKVVINLEQFLVKSTKIYKLIEEYKLKILKENGENLSIHSKGLLEDIFDFKKGKTLSKINFLQLKDNSEIDENRVVELVEKIKEIYQFNLFPKSNSTKDIEFYNYLNQFEVHSNSVTEMINSLTLLEIEFIKLQYRYLKTNAFSFESYYLHLDRVDVFVDGPTCVKEGDQCELKVYMAAIDTSTLLEMYYGDNLIKNRKGNKGIVHLKAKSDSSNYQIVKGKIKFINSNGEEGFHYWQRKIEIVK